FRTFWADIFFGSSAFVPLVAPMALLVAGNALFAVAYGNLRGHLRISQANALRVLVHAVLPLAAALFVRDSVATLLYVMGAGLVLLPVASRLLAAGSVERLRTQVFGIARVIVALILIGIVTFELFATPIVSIYLGPAFAGSVGTLRVLMLGALPWGLYISLR